MANSLSLKELLSRARRRELAHLVVDKTAFALAILMGGMIVLLLAGTEFLAWYWPALITAISLGVALYRLRKSMPTLYSLAQRIDGRLKLADELSTACYFSEYPREDRKAICERQQAHAEKVARQVDLQQAIPFQRSRYLAPALGLALVAVGLFGVRFLFTGTLSLEPSLVRLAYDTFFNSKPYAQNRPPRARLDPQAGDQQDNRSGKEDSPDDLLDSSDNPDAANADADNSQTSAEGQQGDKQDSEKGKQDQNAQGDQSKAGNDPADQNNQQQDSKQGNQNDKDAKPSNTDQNSSMMDKLRDALSNMLNKMKPNSDGKSSPQNSQQGQPGDRQDPGQKNQQSKEQAQNASSGDQQGQDSDQQDQGDNKANQSSDKNANQNSESGAGVKNGDKAIREAEQLQAMGKISEILGKRSANVTGEVMVEVGSSKQQLKTPWAQKQANHSEAGSEIHRDEIPLMDQQFVEQYFEEIRKGAPAPGPVTRRPAKQAGKGVPQAEE